MPQLETIEIAVCIDGPGLLDADMQALKKKGWSLSGQDVRSDGMPVAFFAKQINPAVDPAGMAAATIMRRKLARAYMVEA